MSYWHEKSKEIIDRAQEKADRMGLEGKKFWEHINSCCPYELTDLVGLKAWADEILILKRKIDAKRERENKQGRLF